MLSVLLLFKSSSIFLSICFFKVLSKNKFGCQPLRNLLIIKLSTTDADNPQTGLIKPAAFVMINLIPFTSAVSRFGLSFNNSLITASWLYSWPASHLRNLVPFEFSIIEMKSWIEIIFFRYNSERSGIAFFKLISLINPIESFVLSLTMGDNLEFRIDLIAPSTNKLSVLMWEAYTNPELILKSLNIFKISLASTWSWSLDLITRWSVKFLFFKS